MNTEQTHKGDKVVILGGGKSGLGAAILAKKLGYDVFLSDGGLLDNAFAKALQEKSILFETGSHNMETILQASLVVKSPGIPDNAAIIKEITASGIPVISEIEFASRFSKSTLVAITGSNGKTTVTSLLGHIVKEANLDATVGGNIGESFAGQEAEGPAALRVLEISSFQLDGITSFKPNIAIILNITPDHLDRYDYKFENYVDSKLRISMNQTKDDFLIYNADDTVLVNAIKKHNPVATLVPFSLKEKLNYGAYLDNNTITITLDKNIFTMPIHELSIKGQHNTANAMAASTAARLLQIRKETIRQSMESFQGVEHRLENVLRINKVHYINDSKATNVNAAYYALDSMEQPTIWIVGGTDKGNDYTELLALVNEKVKAIICLGVDNTKIVDTFNNCVDNLIETQSMEDAVRVAYKLATPGDTVLLSPACASFDLFENYEDRGRQFKNAVRNL